MIGKNSNSHLFLHLNLIFQRKFIFSCFNIKICLVVWGLGLYLNMYRNFKQKVSQIHIQIHYIF